MNGFWSVIKREIRKLVNNKFMFIITFLAPIIFSVIMIGVFISGTATDLPIAVLDEDNTDISRNLVRAINSTPAIKVKYKVSNLKEGEDLMKEIKSYALVYIPHDFKSDLNIGRHPKIVCYYNNQMILIGGVVSKDIQSAILNYIAGVDTQIQMKKGLAKKAVSSKINLIRIDEKVHSNPYLNYSYFLSYAAIAHCFQVFITFLAIWSIGIEFKKGTTKIWLKTANNSIINAVFGKLSVYFLVFLIYLLIIYYLYVVLCTAPFKGHILFSILGGSAFIFAYQMMGVLFVAILSNLRFALSVGAFYTALGFSLAGMTFPSIAMPSFAQIYSSLLPVKPFVALIIDQALRGFNPIYDIKYLIWMLAISIIGLISLPLLKKHAFNEDLWYQI